MRLIHPVKIPPASVGQKFGDKWADYSQFDLIAHNGIDFPAPKGTPIYAATDGYIVEQAEKETGYGLRISQRVDEGDKHYLLVYGHLERLANPNSIPYNWKNRKYPVKQGQIIGYVDSTGFSTGHHLHFGVYECDINGKKLNSNNGYQGAIDPMPFIKEQDMEFYKVQGEATIVAKLNGQYRELATPAELFPYVKRTLGIPDTLNPIGRDVVNAHLGKQIVVGITF
jgi:murein DD-endopeptidase MepM/ murein hydrolase activator NlpD